MIDVTPGSLSRGRDWNRVWLESPGHKRSVEELDNNMISRADNSEVGTKGDGFEFAMPLWQQAELVNHHMNVALYRNTDYINNKFALHIFSTLFNGFSFWMLGDSKSPSLIFSSLSSPSSISSLSLLVSSLSSNHCSLHATNVYEARENKLKMYSWIAFVTGLVVSEIPYLIL